MSEPTMTKMVAQTVTGASYSNALTSDEVAEIVAMVDGGLSGLVHAMAQSLGTADNESSTLKFKDGRIGWVALNPRHVVAIEFHGTIDVE